jgi:pimeloyl-ACP methyl ester carboxylesterase
MVWYASKTITRRRKPDPIVNPADLDLEYTPATFLSRDGMQLGGWLVPGASPSRGTVILCHGHAGSLDADLHYVPAFHRHGFDVLQFDFRAHGRSEGRCVSMGYYERQDLLGAVDYIRNLGIDRVGVLGFSMGGAVAIASAAQCPSIAGVVADGAFARIETTIHTGLEQRGVPYWLARMLAPIIVRVTGWRLGADLPAADPLLWIGKISPRPLLLIHGGQDAYVPRSEIDALYTAAGNPKALWIVPEADHRRVDQVRPDEYQERVLEFFEGCLSEEEQDEPMAAG